ncbi:unnamed protein product [Oppiella nova]|uniref:Uncharacterized protein n=1 Tax=Oppiella nova TaxID=334625 RepID=A0A7R9Q9R4_9ACAR|nr:unnamed protein product [Oppiella nova]CAG2160833.1 unnamed protein product [Oppiella nova]
MAQFLPLAAPLIAVAQAIAENQNEQRQIKLRDNENSMAMDMIKRQNSLVNNTRMKEINDYMRNMQTGMTTIIDQCHRREARQVAKSQLDNFNQLVVNQKSQQDNFNQFTTKITQMSERQHNDHVTLLTALISMQMETKRFMMLIFTSMMFIIIALVLDQQQ